MIETTLARVVAGEDLAASEVEATITTIMSGQVPEPQIAGFLTALRIKGETAAEVVGCARSMRANVRGLHLHRPVIDTCGTGGDGSSTFNVSTAAAFIVAGCGVAVAKHGNRAISSRCGSADVIEELGIDPSPGTDAVKRCIEEAGLGFLYAPMFHRAMKHVAEVRRQLGFRTIFNIAGPLTNPAGLCGQVVGVFAPELVSMIASVLVELEVRRAFVVHGAGGLDEVSLCGATLIADINGPAISVYEVKPEDFGLPTYQLKQIAGGLPAENAEIIKGVLSGQRGAYRDTAVANAAVALVAAGHASCFATGVKAAEEAIDSGAASACLQRLREIAPGGRVS